jgi:fructoselysine-6-P-deglycase FrlB-like protein
VAVLFGTEAGATLEAALIQDLRKHGATTVVIRDGARIEGNADVSIALGAGLSDLTQSVLYLPFAQLLAYWRAIGADLNPDRPQHLSSVVRL